MRGTHYGDDAGGHIHGIIPAYAGNTSAMPLSPDLPRDHPRVCGEHVGDAFVSGFAEGSSPRMRGTLVQELSFDVPAGIIPAYAGNTDEGSCPRHPAPDHPRVCGEHGIMAALM